MNDRWGAPRLPANPCGYDDGPSCVPLVPHGAGETPARTAQDQAAPKKLNHRGVPRKEAALYKDALFEVWRDDACHIISENYFYKTEPYYTILRHELEGKPVRPSSSAVLDAYVVPICLERAHLAGIPVCEWGISQGYVPLPSILYGLNYFATTSDYFVVSDNEKAKEAIKHITNKGKYPFCYQKLADGADDPYLHRRSLGRPPGTAACGRRDCQRRSTISSPSRSSPWSWCRTVTRYRLSSLSPTRYSQLSGEERALLSAYLSHQEFL